MKPIPSATLLPYNGPVRSLTNKLSAWALTDLIKLKLKDVESVMFAGLVTK